MPWRTRKKGSRNQKGQHFFIPTHSHQALKNNLPRISPLNTEAEKNRMLDNIEDIESEREQGLYGLDIGAYKLSKEQLEQLEKDKDTNINAPYEGSLEGTLPNDSFPVPQNQKPSLFDRIKIRITTKPKKGESD